MVKERRISRILLVMKALKRALINGSVIFANKALKANLLYSYHVGLGMWGKRIAICVLSWSYEYVGSSPVTRRRY